MIKQIVDNKVVSTHNFDCNMDVVEIDEYFYVDFKNINIKDEINEENLIIDNIIITFEKVIENDKLILCPIIDIARIEHDFQASIYRYSNNDITGDKYINNYIQSDDCNLEMLKKMPLLYKLSLTIVFEYYRKFYNDIAVTTSNFSEVDEYIENNSTKRLLKK